MRNDRIKGLHSEFLISMIWQDQNQREGRSHRRQSLGDCITAIRVRRIWTDANRFRSRIKRQVKSIYRCSGYEIDLYFAACDQCVLLKTIIQTIPVCIHKINRAQLGVRRRIVWRNFRLKIKNNWRMNQVASTAGKRYHKTVRKIHVNPAKTRRIGKPEKS